jgi:nicotinamidase-related amidase
MPNNMTYIAPSLLRPDDHAVIMIDHQYLQLLTERSRDVTILVNAAVAMAKTATLFGVPTLLTTAFAERQPLIKQIQDLFPEQKPIDRMGLNAFEDERVVQWVEQTGKKRFVISGLWTENCLALSALSALSAGYKVYIPFDACGGNSKDSHDMAVQRLIQAGAVPLTAQSYMKELQRDWTRPTSRDVVKIAEESGIAYGEGLKWERSLLGLEEGTR